MRLGLAGDVEPGREQALVAAEARGDSGRIARGRDHRIAGLQGGFGDQSAKSAGCSCDEPDTHDVALSILARRCAEPMGKV